MSERLWDLLIVGGGPAGMAAAARAAEWGLAVALLDDNRALGGQIWRGQAEGGAAGAASAWAARLAAAGAAVFRDASVFDAPAPGVLWAEMPAGGREFRYRKLLLATGARELFLPFPGWTRRNVLGAGGMQALVKSGLPIAGKRVVVAGSGPLLLAVAAYLREHGAEIPLLCEQASPRSLAGFALELARSPAKLAQGWSLRRSLAGVPFAAGCWPLAAEGGDVITAVVVRRGGRGVRIACDYLACGFHLVPNVELPVLLGCRLRDGAVAVDDLQQTSRAEVYCAGEPTGIGGLDAALAQGQIAAAAAAGRLAEVAALRRARARSRRFAAAMNRAFQPRPELRALAAADTLVCRCEDVSHARLAAYDCWRAAKLHTRCGMGACQGRVCGAAARFLFGWEDFSVRPPLVPVSVESLERLQSSRNAAASSAPIR